jgi:hypothetical protein
VLILQIMEQLMAAKADLVHWGLQQLVAEVMEVHLLLLLALQPCHQWHLAPAVIYRALSCVKQQCLPLLSSLQQLGLLGSCCHGLIEVLMALLTK